MDNEFRLLMIGKLFSARVAIENAIAALQMQADPVIAENMTIAEGHLADARMQWRERPQ